MDAAAAFASAFDTVVRPVDILTALQQQWSNVALLGLGGPGGPLVLGQWPQRSWWRAARSGCPFWLKLDRLPSWDVSNRGAGVLYCPVARMEQTNAKGVLRIL